MTVTDQQEPLDTEDEVAADLKQQATKTAGQDQADKPDLEAIAPDEQEITVNGVRCRVKRLKLREMLALARIVSSGAGEGLARFNLDTSNPEQMQADMIGIVMYALPNAADETFVFLQQVVEPIPSGRQARNKVDQAMENPDLDTAVDIINLLFTQEMDDLFELVGKVQSLASQQSQAFRQMQSKRGNS